VATSTGERAAPKVSVVVPVFDRERFVAATVASVLAQTMPSFELIVFDDGSRDGSLALCRRLAASDERIRVVAGPNEGVASARNRGLAATDRRSQYVIFLDSDDIWEPDTLEVLIEALEDRPELVSAYGLADCIDPDGRPVAGDDLEQQMRRRVAFRDGALTAVGDAEPTSFEGLVHHNWVVTAGIHLIRRSVLTEVGPFDVATDPADDWDLVIRTSRRGPIGYLPRVVLHWRRHGATLTETSPHWKRAYFAVLGKTLIDPTNTPEQLAAARCAFAELIRSSARESWSRLRTRDLPGAARAAARAAQTSERYATASVTRRRLERSLAR
jgi:glycosyltransferase involved in cell wall biosynthesis